MVQFYIINFINFCFKFQNFKKKFKNIGEVLSTFCFTWKILSTSPVFQKVSHMIAGRLCQTTYLHVELLVGNSPCWYCPPVFDLLVGQALLVGQILEGNTSLSNSCLVVEIPCTLSDFVGTSPPQSHKVQGISPSLLWCILSTSRGTRCFEGYFLL